MKRRLLISGSEDEALKACGAKGPPFDLIPGDPQIAGKHRPCCAVPCQEVDPLLVAGIPAARQVFDMKGFMAGMADEAMEA